MDRRQMLKAVKNILIISICIELAIVIYNFGINKLYGKLHFINNSIEEITRENIRIEEDDNSIFLKISNIQVEKIYNVSLVLSEKNKDVYMRILYNNDNDEKIMPKENAEGSKFKVYFISGLKPENFSIVFEKSELDVEKINKVIINDNIDYMPEVRFSIIQVFVIFTIIFGIYVCGKIYKFSNQEEKIIKKEWMFLSMSIIIGTIFVFINVPQVRYDEHAHMWRAYELSEGHIISKMNHELPTSIIDLFRRDDGTYPNKEFNYNTLKIKLSDKLEKEKKEPFPVGATASLTPISYLPQLIGVFVGKILNLGPIKILWLGRFTNLATYVVLIFFAIKIMPSEKFKSIIMMIGLFPMSLTMAATMSPDSLIIATTILAIAYGLHLKFDVKRIRMWDIIKLAVLCMIPTICKIVYFPLCLMFLMIPKKKFESHQKRILYYVLMIGIIFVPYLIFNRILALGEIPAAIRTNTIEQGLFIISDLVRDVQTAINTMYSELSLYLFELIGGWNTIKVISVILLIMILMVSYSKSEDGNNYLFTKKDKIIGGIIIALEVLSVIGALYLTWTQSKQTVVEGVQGRYFLPTIPLLLIIFGNDLIEVKIKNKKIKYMLILSICFIIIFGFSIRAYI